MIKIYNKGEFKKIDDVTFEELRFLAMSNAPVEINNKYYYEDTDVVSIVEDIYTKVILNQQYLLKDARAKIKELQDELNGISFAL